MSLSDRDRKILIFIVPLVVLAAFWFLLISPKREEATQAAKELDQQQQRLDQAQAAANAAKGAKTGFAADYGEIVRLGKAIPSTIDMPSLLVQLDRAAAGTSIRFTRIATGERQAATSVAAPPAASSGATPAPPADAGGAQAQSGPGTAAESANDTAAASNQQAQATDQSSAAPADTQTSTPAGVAPGTGTTAIPAAPAGLETVPLELEFVGNFFNLADFFHDVKRFVHAAESNVTVGGRLITIDGINFSSDPELFPRLKAQLTATIYLSPKSEGVTAGATPQGPALTPAAESSDPSASPAPAATATPIGQ